MRQRRRRFPDNSPTALPVIAAVLTAALTNPGAVEWRDRFGSPSLPELANLTCLL